MSDSNDNYHYEIALTNRQVLVSFVVLLFCVLAAFAMGVWVGRMDEGQVFAAEAPPAEGTSEMPDLDNLEEFRFGSQGGEQELDKPDLSQLRGGARETPASGSGTPPSARPRAGGAGASTGDTTLAEDVRGARPAPPTEPRQAPPPPRRAAPPSNPTPRQAPPAGAKATEGFVVQVFSTYEQATAKKLRQRLRQGGYRRAFLSPVEVANQTMYRVRVGPFAERSPAEKVAAAIKSEFQLETWITAASN